MYKIFQIPVTGIDGSEDIGVNTSVRTTMGYNAANKEISVLVEKIVLPEVPTTESVDLRVNHTEATFETLLEKTFTPADFPKTMDAVRWVVDYDVEKNELVGPFNALEYTKTKITGNLTHRAIPKIVKYRYNNNLIPLFAIDSFFKSAQDFDASVLTVYTDKQGLAINDTILNGDLASSEEVDQSYATTWVYQNLNVNVQYEILDDDGKVVASNLPFVKPEAKSTPTIKTFEVLSYDSANPNNNEVSNLGGNQYKIQLPVQDHYNVRIIFGTEYTDKKLPINFDITCVNGLCNKSRATSSGYDKDRFAAGQETNQNIIKYKNQHDKTTSRLSLTGVDSVLINTTGLIAGDYVKLKLNLGEFQSYSELWIELI